LNEGKIDKPKTKDNVTIAKMSHNLIKRKANDLVEMIINDELINVVNILNK